MAEGPAASRAARPTGPDWIGPDWLVRVVVGGLFLRPWIYRRVAAEAASWRLCLACLLLGRAGRGGAAAVVSGMSAGLAVLIEFALGAVALLIESGLILLCARVFLRRSEPLFGRILRAAALARLPEALALPVAGLLVGGEASPGWLGVALEATWVWQIAALGVAVQAALGVSWLGAVGLTLMVGVLGRLLPVGLEFVLVLLGAA